MTSIVLASTSARRKTLLRQLGLKFVVVPSLVEEKMNPRLKPKGQAEALSLQKAQAVAKKYINKKNDRAVLVIAADTIVAIEDEVLGKPRDEKEARQILRKLSGRKHCVITGFSIVDTNLKKTITKSIETGVYFKKLSEREIREYIRREKVMDKAGAYAAQGLGASIIERIEGDYFNVVGLPLHALSLELRKFGIKIL